MYFSLYKILKKYNTWPKNISILQHPAKFLKVVEYCDTIEAQLIRSENERKRVEAELKKKQGLM